MADRRREPQLLRATRLGGARRRTSDDQQLAPGEGDAPARQQAKELRPLPAHLRAAQSKSPAPAEGADGGRGVLRDPEAFDDALEVVATWPRDERRAGAKCCSRRWSSGGSGVAIKRSLGLAPGASPASSTRNAPSSAGLRPSACWGCSSTRRGAPRRNARRIVHAARQQDRRLAISLLPPRSRTPGGRGGVAGARMRMARKPPRSPASCFATSPSPVRWKARRRRRQERVATTEGWGGNGAGERRGERRRRSARWRKAASRMGPTAGTSPSSPTRPTPRLRRNLARSRET